MAEPGFVERLSPDWSRDGARLAWVDGTGPRPRATGHQAIAVQVLETGEVSELLRPDSGAAIEEPVPGPGGGTLYFKENREKPGGERVQRVVRRDLSTGEEATLFATESGGRDGWACSGWRYLATGSGSRSRSSGRAGTSGSSWCPRAATAVRSHGGMCCSGMCGAMIGGIPEGFEER